MWSRDNASDCGLFAFCFVVVAFTSIEEKQTLFHMYILPVKSSQIAQKRLYLVPQDLDALKHVGNKIM